MFVEIKGMKAKLFVHEKQDNSEKKHKCDDCFQCQWCDDDRCRACLKKKKCLKNCSGEKNSTS